MTKQFKSPFKNTKLKPFFFFLFLATLFWILTKFSREYTATTTASINYINIPKTTLVTDGSLKEITFDLSANGFEFLLYKLRKPSVDVDLRRYYKEGQMKVTIPKNELVKLVSSHLNADLAINNISVEELSISLDTIVSKKIPVFVKTNFSYKDGFKPIDSIKISPDSIVVSGPSIYLEAIDFAETIEVSENNLDKTFLKTVEIQNFVNKKVSFEPQEVSVSVNVAEFSQKEMVLPIAVINIPEGTSIKLIPNIVSMSFNVSVDDFTEITEKDFKLVCDYAQRDIEENFMIPNLIKSPPGIINIEFDPKKIDYLIFK